MSAEMSKLTSVAVFTNPRKSSTSKYQLPKLVFAGSNPVTRSKAKKSGLQQGRPLFFGGLWQGIRSPNEPY